MTKDQQEQIRSIVEELNNVLVKNQAIIGDLDKDEISIYCPYNGYIVKVSTQGYFYVPEEIE